MSNDSFWFENLSILFNKNRLLQFIPTKFQTLNEKLNSICRFFIYFSLIMIILKRDINYLIILIFGFIITFLIYYNANTKENMITNYTKPTKNNPFMNVLINEYVENPTRPPAASFEDPDIRQEVEKHFNYNLYKDVDDIWSKANSQRQYYTTPNTQIPNDRDSFAKWCYEAPKVCKDGDLEMCGKYETLQINKHGKI
jgi:hypothetical protein